MSPAELARMSRGQHSQGSPGVPPVRSSGVKPFSSREIEMPSDTPIRLRCQATQTSPPGVNPTF